MNFFDYIILLWKFDSGRVKVLCWRGIIWNKFFVSCFFYVYENKGGMFV